VHIGRCKNIGSKLSQDLEAIGIHTHEDLVTRGSLDTLKALGGGCANRLYALEGAIRGMRWHDLDPKIRQDLLEAYKESR